MKTSLTLAVFAVIISSSSFCHPQVYGSPQGLGLILNESYSHGDIDQVNLSNGNLVVNIPIVSLPQLGALPPLEFSIVGNSDTFQEYEACDELDSCYDYIDYNYSGPVGPGLNVVASMGEAQLSSTWQETVSSTAFGGGGFGGGSQCQFYNGGLCDYSFSYQMYYAVNDPTGSTHSMVLDNSTMNGPSYTMRSVDGSGFSFVTPSPVFNASSSGFGELAVGTLYDSHGVAYAPVGSIGGGPLTASDPSGNTLSYQGGIPRNVSSPAPLSTAPLYTDSLGRQIYDPGMQGAIAGVNFELDQNPGNVSQCPNLGVAGQPALYAFSWTPPNPSGPTQTYVFCYTAVIYHTGFYGDIPVDDSVWPFLQQEGDVYCCTVLPSVDPNDGAGIINTFGALSTIQSVVLPNGTYWGFVYDSAGYSYETQTTPIYQTLATTGIPTTYGDLIEIRYPTNATIDYTHINLPSTFTTLGQSAPVSDYSRLIASRTVGDGLGHLSPTTYNYVSTSSGIVTETDALNNDTVHKFTAMEQDFEAPSANFGAYETEVDRYSGTAGMSVPLQTITTQFQYGSGVDTTGCTYYCNTTAEPLPWQVTTSTSAGVVRVEQRAYQQEFTGIDFACVLGTTSNPLSACWQVLQYPNLRLDQVGSDSVLDSSGTVLQSVITVPEFIQNSSYKTANLLDIPYSVTVTGQGGNSSVTTYGYDTRGDQTSIMRTVNPGGSTITTTKTYTPQGMLASVTDPRGGTTTTTYDSTGLYPTEIQQPTTGTTAHIDYYSFDANTGNLNWHTDQNGSGPDDLAHTATYCYDSSGRMTKAYDPPSPVGQCQSGQPGSTSIAYNDSARMVTASVLATPDPTQVSSETFDGLGRVVGAMSPNGSTTETTYDLLGRVASVSNPHFTTPSTTDGYTTHAYDALSRPLFLYHPDNSYQQWSYDVTGLVTTFTDEVGNSSQGTTDALGRLTEVVEAGGQTTTYGYDGLGNLLAINQLGVSGDTPRTRIFTYDSLSRLLKSSNPETGTVTTAYVNAGALCAGDISLPCNKTDARGISANFTYDALNRLVSKTYSDGTLSSCYTFDTATNGVGLLGIDWTQTGNCSTAGENSGYQTRSTYVAYDAVGRLWNEQQCTFGNCTIGSYSPPCQAGTVSGLSYCYDLAGNLIYKSAGIGNVPGVGTISLANSYDSAGRLSSLTSSWIDAQHPSPLLTANSYAPQGGLLNATYGSALNLTRSYDNRLRLTSETDLGLVQSGGVSGGNGSIAVAGTEDQGSGTPSKAIIHVVGDFGDYKKLCPYISAQTYTNCVTIAEISGTLSLTVNGSTVSVAYSGTPNVEQLADQISATINGTSGFPVSASNVNGYITLTSSTVGAGNDYAISISFDGDDLTCSAAANFAMSGGTNATGSPDSGSVVVTVNGIPSAPVTWNSSSTYVTLADALVLAIQDAAGEIVTVQAASSPTYGVSTIYLKSKETGLSSSYPISVNVTDNAPGIGSPSFTFTPLSLSGGSSGQATAATVYSYNIPSPTATTGYAPNGNLLSYTDSVMGSNSFVYDSLNRLMSSTSSGGYFYYGYTSGTIFGCWTYDSFGNRTSESDSGTPCTNSPPKANWANYNANNQMTTTNQLPGGAPATAASLPNNGIYDPSGNVINDGINQYLYDAEGHLCVVASQPIPSFISYTGYLYNAEGQRVAKGNISSWSCNTATNGFTPTNEYVLDQSGNQITESAVSNGNATWIHTNVDAGSSLIATYLNDDAGPHFRLTDWLGTPRLQTNYAGVREQTCQSLPFGDGPPSCASGTEQFFTGKERDPESGNDYFSARYYASSTGRFMSPDPSGIALADMDRPTSLNLYSYTTNNPLVYIDPNGLVSCWAVLAGINTPQGAYTLPNGNPKENITVPQSAAVYPYPFIPGASKLLNRVIGVADVAAQAANDGDPTQKVASFINGLSATLNPGDKLYLFVISGSGQAFTNAANDGLINTQDIAQISYLSAAFVGGAPYTNGDTQFYSGSGAIDFLVTLQARMLGKKHNPTGCSGHGVRCELGTERPRRANGIGPCRAMELEPPAHLTDLIPFPINPPPPPVQ